MIRSPLKRSVRDQKVEIFVILEALTLRLSPKNLIPTAKISRRNYFLSMRNLNESEPIRGVERYGA